jgi:quinol-cytochrome oxidoreductase complex cytochrome b subunit
MDVERLKQTTGLSALYYKIPQHANTIWYSFGGVTLFCFLVAMASGILMAQFYSPSPSTAYASVKYISTTSGIQIIRGVHYWAANLGFVMLIIHMLRIIITGAFRPPRIITYFVGLGLLLMIFLIYFTGTMLRADHESYEAMRHFLAVNKLFGTIGAFFQEDFTLSTSMLSRVFAMHTSALQIIFITILVLHIFYIKYFGISPKPYQNEEQYQKSLNAGSTFMGHAKLLGILSAGMFIIILGLGLLIHPVLLGPPKPGMEMTKPAWPFLVFVPLENHIGIPGIPIGMAIAGIYFLLFPIMGLAIRNERKLFKTVYVAVAIGLLFWFAMMIIAYVSPVQSHFGSH